MKRSALGIGVVWAAAMILVVGCQDNETAIARGDRLWADSAFDHALAEYRLAVAQRDDDQARARLAHAYARAGRYPEMSGLYRDLLPRNPALVDQAIYDYLHVVHRATRRGDVYTAAVALDEALELRPEVRADPFLLAAARFHRQRGDTERAEAYYARALTNLPPDSTPRVLYELGVLHEEAGRCDVAVEYFTAFRTLGQRDQWRLRLLLGEARWHMGNCSFRLAREAREQGQVTAALRHLDTVVELGEPEHLLDQVWLDRGELLYGLGRFDAALEAFRTVLERSPARTGPLVERAQRRIDDIRFGPRPEVDIPFGQPRPDRPVPGQVPTRPPGDGR
jgi:tetratricopeptide (TPR) repeat protein